LSEQSFRADRPEGWGAGGKSPLLCFDGSFGSSHGIVFAGSGGFKTTSVTIPTALKWGSTLVVLDPSNEVAPMVLEHRGKAGRDIHRPRSEAPGIRLQRARLDRPVRRH
jgi:type IV secretion system protein VirD4